MKDYSLDRDSKKSYIVEMFIAENKTITVVFADGTRFENIAYTQENIDKIAAVQEQQAKKAVANMKTFQKKETLSLVGFMGSAVACGALGYCAELTGWGNNPVAAAAIAIGITGSVMTPSIISLMRSVGRTKELQKIKYRDDNRATLEEYRNHPNALVGVRNRRHFAYCRSHGEDPFSMLAIDTFTQEDLETIVSNVEREKDYGFEYQKRYSR